MNLILAYRKCLKWVVFLILGTVYAQDYERVDATIQLYPDRFNSAEELSRFITRDFSTEEDKVRAIYGWIIQNVAYDPEEYKKFNYNFKNFRERNQKEEKTREKVIIRTLQHGVAVCEGYAMLFERLCELQGISNYLVRGDIKSNFNDIERPFKNSHMWNVAIIDGESFLFDPTWGAGKYREKFVKEPSYYYYKTPPEQMIKSHFPQLQEDTFLLENMSREEFSKLPLVIHPDLTLKDLVSPSDGVISSFSESGEVEFEVRSDAPGEMTYTFGNERQELEFEAENGSLKFRVPIELGSSILLVYFDDQPALGFKIK